jgi:hypothetical protein
MFGQANFLLISLMLANMYKYLFTTHMVTTKEKKVKNITTEKKTFDTA